MSEQFEHNGVDKVPFRDLLNAAMPAIKMKSFRNIRYHELLAFAYYIQYKVQRDFFELVVDVVPEPITWEDFISVLDSSEKLLDGCRDIIGRKLESAFFQYDFSSRDLDFSQCADIPDTDKTAGIKLFSDADGVLLIELFLYFAEQTHFNYLRETMHPDYRWEEYHFDLHYSRELWKELLTAFRNTILCLDFKELWAEVEVDFE